MTKRKSFGIRSAVVWILAALILPCFGGCSKTPPEGLVRDLTWALGAPLPIASDFAGENGEGFEYTFVEDPYARIQSGANPILLRVRQPNGKKIELNATLTLVEDHESPKLTGVRNLETFLNTPISLYWDGISISDNCDGPITKQVDLSRVDYSKTGVYEIVYTVSDQVGNQSSYTALVEVVDRIITAEMLYEKLDVQIQNLGLIGLPILEQCKKIYSFVNDSSTIHYKGVSNDPARIGWVREAYLALETGEGDCYTYFALSKAFFERLGIQNLDVQRLPGMTEDTHYWSMVNIGSENAPRWYHFDATRLKEPIYSSGILTDAQIQYYSECIRPYFYFYDTSKYPSTDTAEVSERIS